MKRRVAYWLARLYPAAWRERYGEEFDALVEDARPGWRGLADIGWGALAMQWRTGPSPAWFTLMLAAVGLAVAAPVAWRIPDRFMSTAALSMPSHGGDEGAVAVAAKDALRRETLLALMERHHLYEHADREESLTRFKQNISVSLMRVITNGRQQAFRMAFVHDDAAKAQLVTRELMTLVIDEYARQNPAASPVEVLDMPALPLQPIYPNRPVILFTGLLAGAVLGALIALIRRGGTMQMLRSAAIGALAAAVLLPAAVHASRILTAQPVAVAEVAVKGDSGSTEGRAAIGRAVHRVMSGEALSGLAARYQLGPVAELRERLSIMHIESESGRNSTVRLMFQHEDRRIAEGVVGHLVASLIAEHPPQLEVLQPPTVGTRQWPPAYATRPMFFSALLGAALGICFAGLRQSRTP